MSVFFYKTRQKWACNYIENGKKKRRLFATEQEAASFCVEMHQDQEELTRLTLGELAVLFFQSNEDYYVKTKQTIIKLLAGREKNGKHIEGAGEFLRNKYADSLTRKDLEQFRVNIKKSGKASNATCNRYQAYLKSILSWGVEQELIVLNPWRDTKHLKTKQRIFRTTLAQFQKIIENSPEWLQWAFYVAYSCALRFGQVELFSMTWDAFHWKQGLVQLHQGKSGKIKRVFPPQDFLNIAFLRFEQDVKNGIPLVCHRQGKKVFAYNKDWEKAVKLAGFQGLGIRPYDIRHLAATEMLANGADLAAVSAQLGHSNIVTTGTYYAHVTVGSQQRASEKLTALVAYEQRSEQE